MPRPTQAHARRRRAFSIAAAVIAAMSGAGGGCFVHLPADSTRANLPVMTVQGDAWPRWDEDALNRVRMTLEDRPADRDIDLSSIGGPRVSSEYRGRVLHTRDAIVRVWFDEAGSLANRSEFLGELVNGFESNAEILTAARFGTEPERRAAEYRWASEQAVGDGRSRGFPPGEMCLCGLDAVDLERRDWTYALDARFPSERPPRPRGILIHHPSLMGNDYERAVVSLLRARGWIVLSVETRKSITAPLGDARVAKALALELRINELRREESKKAVEGGGLSRDIFAPAPPERASLEKELAEVVRARWVVTDDESADRAGREIAQRVDAGLAEGAVATRAALDALLAIRPELAGLPVSMVAFSAGSLAATTIAASLVGGGGRVSCVALVGPACNLAAAGRRSDLFSGGIVLVDAQGKKVDETLGLAVERAYLRHSRLDPYHTAPALVRTPVLVVRGWFDGWVPAELCDVLIDRLGRPDRLAVPGGHQVLFYLLPSQGDWIADWLDTHTPPTPGYSGRSTS